MNFFIVGAGAMGCLFAARLQKAGFKVFLRDYLPDRAALINRKGLRVEGIDGEYEVEVPTLTTPPAFKPEAVLICVKAYATAVAAQAVKEWLPPEAVIVTMQNGLGNVETLEQIFGPDRVLGGVTSEGATTLAPGRIRHAGRGDTVIGPSRHPQTAAIAAAFNAAGFKTRTIEKVDNLIWSKLIVNVGINALAAITRLKNGRLPALAGAKTVMEIAVKEAVAVAQAKQIQLSYPDPLARVLEVCRLTADNIASMLQDVLKHKQTEIDYINGAIVREGERLAVPTPVNQALTALVHAIQESYEDRLAR
ncbi:MAG: 2-dehydropantoate 2-reductase [Desulfobacteraceae bacterium]|nr:MAG: 2-dehydropantoate 2-reductase [Desulfobacteraceae bacterium]